MDRERTVKMEHLAPRAFQSMEMMRPVLLSSRPMKNTASYLAAALLATTLAACSTVDVYRKCGFAGCAGDARITASVEGRLRENLAIEYWGIQVQTLDHVVYLYGLVDTGLERNIIESTALEVPGVERVVNSIGIRNTVW
jgi:osmotically-inducible protein OsmY